MNYKKYISEYIESIDMTKEKILFFKGFPKEFYDQLMQYNQLPRFTDFSIEYVFQNDKEVRNLVVPLLMYNKKVSWGTYEELIAISQTINDISTIYKGEIEVINNNLYKGFYESYSSTLIEIINNVSSEGEETIFDVFYSDYKVLNEGVLVEYILKHKDGELGAHISENNFFKKEFKLVGNPSDEAFKITENEINQIVYDCLSGEYKNAEFVVNTLPTNEEYLNKRINLLNDLLQESRVRFYCGKSAKKNIQPKDSHLIYFKKHWVQTLSIETHYFTKTQIYR